MCHTWRNYLALGAIGPDLFYLLPDYTGTVGTVVRDVVKWALDVWEAIDSAFLTKWEKWIGPVATDRTQLASQLQGGLGPQLAQVLDEASSAARTDTPYEGRDDAPAYDYWSGFPAYDDSDTPTGAQARHAFFDLDTGPLPAHLVKAIQDVMAGVHPDGPKILAKQPAFSATDAAGHPDGRPNEAALAEMWQLVYRYLKLTASDGGGVRAVFAIRLRDRPLGAFVGKGTPDA